MLFAALCSTLLPCDLGWAAGRSPPAPDRGHATLRLAALACSGANFINGKPAGRPGEQAQPEGV